ncbi:disintegrin and metalloproteinase domain-containing protein 25-like [Nannospalax galili]|uniref:disintegrin and metalloproteinase domain-containing protein 25-like n=1 Tax=Nannospalax galili TaxID=1026970 RepID=UPI0004ED6ABD|nr:disintegrin and metalloproteinase domain-containing protein 25-like [Nannospalax galili]
MVALGESLVHVRITFLKLWLGIFLFLSSWSVTWHFQQYRSPPEVVIPRKVTDTRRNTFPPGWLSYSLHIGGQRHIISMKSKEDLISRHLTVFTYSDQGGLLEDQPFVQKDCYYHGFVDGDPESVVALTTCFGGFKGLLQINNIAYEIKPKNLSTAFEHLVYKMDTEDTDLLPMRCGLTEEEIVRQLKLQENDTSILKQSDYEGWWAHKLIVELVLVIDHTRFVYRENNITHVQEDVFTILIVMNGHYIPLEVDVLLRGFEIWNEGNPILVESTIESVLTSFCQWKKDSFADRIPHDVAHLIVKYDYGKSVGLAWVGGICNPKLSCAVNSFKFVSPTVFAQTVSHELGHNLGMIHDEFPCTCGRKHCVMYATKGDGTTFSNCSYNTYYSTVRNKNCMYNSPSLQDIITFTRCGNGVLEEGEECDCGSYHSCAKNLCCKSDCTLKGDADCASGLCCKDCHFMPSGTVCREQNDECDLPEWCNGTYHDCPEDVYMYDGSPCRSGGYCYGKRCNSHDEQCQQVFGKGARSAPESCYMEMNTKGDRFGNCGTISTESYAQCNVSNILCGRLQCENVNEIPLLRDHSTVYWSHFNDVTCWGTDYHLGMGITDIGDVKDGTVCGPEHVCIQRKCVRKSTLKSGCLPATCNMNGVCNNKDHCHCSQGWGPPNCLLRGAGGSVDSGPPPPGKRWWLLYLFTSLLILLVLCGVSFSLYKKCKKPTAKETPPPPKAETKTTTTKA